MSDYQERYIVQDLDTFEFLCQDENGGIDETPYLSMAGKYHTYEDAFNAGVDEVGGYFSVFKFYEQAT